MPRHVLITGGAGFIGSHTTDALLASGHRVRILDNLDPQVHGPERSVPSYLSPDAEFVDGDVRDADAVGRALRGIDAVYHFAATTGTAQSMYEKSRYIDVNVTGTAVLWDAIASSRAGVGRVILASSRAVYGEGAGVCPSCGPVAPEGRSEEQLLARDWAAQCPHCKRPVASLPTPETHPTRPHSVYAATKAFQEEVCRQAAAMSGCDSVVLRYFNVYGPRQSLMNAYTGIATVFLGRIMADEPIHLFEDGLPERDFVSVFDVARANLLALEADLPRAGPINIGTGHGTTIRRMAEILCATVGAVPRLTVTGWSRLGDIRSGIADRQRAKEVLDFEALVSVEEGVANLVPYVLEHLPGGETYRDMLHEIRRKGILLAPLEASMQEG